MKISRPRFARAPVAAALTLCLNTIASSVSAQTCTAVDPPPPCDASIPTGSAKIWRDENGVAHIEAAKEEDAWRALGYEEARDALLGVQANIKRFRGEAAKYFGGTTDLPENDFAVKYYRLYLGDALTGTPTEKETKLKTLLRRTNAPTGREDQVFTNLKAYAAGLESYRVRLKLSATLNAREQAYKEWLLSKGYQWAISEGTVTDKAAISVFDVASWGAWNEGTLAFQIALNKDARTARGSASLPLTNQDANSFPPFKSLPGGPDFGSNSFSWMNNPDASFMVPPGSGGLFKGGLVADPHQSFYKAAYKKNAEAFFSENGGRIFVHMRVCDPVEPLNVFGWRDPGSGVLGAFFNENVAIGGSLGDGNPADAFLLRVSPSTGHAATYYSYSTDSFVGFESLSIPIEVKDADTGIISTVTYNISRAGTFGFFLSTKTVNGGAPSELYDTNYYASSSPTWNASATQRNPFGTTDFGAATIPVRIVFRSPFDPTIVTGETQSSPYKHMYRLAVGQYEAMHATSVGQIQAQVAALELCPGPNLMAADRTGHIFAVNSTLCPRRGDNAGICTFGIDSESKWYIYDQSDREPVPMRFPGDSVFDWVFTGGQLQFLKPTGVGDASNPSYLPYMFFDANDFSHADADVCHQTTVPTNRPSHVASANDHDNTYENPGFATMSNNAVHLAYKKAIGLGALVSPCFATACTPRESPDSRQLNSLLLAGTSYAFRSTSTAVLEKNKNIIDFLIDAAYPTDPLHPLNRPPMDCAAARSFAIDNRQYVPMGIPVLYTGYKTIAATTTLIANARTYPVGVRNLAEMSAVASSLIAEAEKERAFFEDLWIWLNSPGSQNANLRNRWVLGGLPPFWYPSYPNPGPSQTIDMPDGARLIDFLWSESRIGTKRLGDGVMSPTERDRFVALASDLAANWPEYRNAQGSHQAGLFLEYDLGFNAATNGLEHTLTPPGSAPVIDEEGRPWTPLANGLLRATVDRTYDYTAPPACSSALNPSTGGLPTNWTSEGLIPSCGSNAYLLRYYVAYSSFAHNLLFTDNDIASVMFDCTTCPDTERSQHPVMKIPTPPYTALYSNVAARQTKTTLSPADINELVKFFLVQLGQFDLVAGSTSSTTNKKTKYEDWSASSGAKNETLPYPYYYPLTRNLARVLLMRRLLEADDFMTQKGLSTWGDIYRTRVYDFRGNLKYPATEDGLPCDGGSIRETGALLEDDDTDGRDSERGFQARVWATGGSDKTMLVLFPYDSAKLPRTYFIHFPGTTQSAFDSPHFVGMVEHFRNRSFADTHFGDYRTSALSPDNVSFPQNPYVYP